MSDYAIRQRSNAIKQKIIANAGRLADFMCTTASPKDIMSVMYDLADEADVEMGLRPTPHKMRKMPEGRKSIKAVFIEGINDPEPWEAEADEWEGARWAERQSQLDRAEEENEEIERMQHDAGDAVYEPERFESVSEAPRRGRPMNPVSAAVDPDLAIPARNVPTADQVLARNKTPATLIAALERLFDKHMHAPGDPNSPVNRPTPWLETYIEIMEDPQLVSQVDERISRIRDAMKRTNLQKRWRSLKVSAGLE